MNEKDSLRIEWISAWCGPAFAVGLIVFFGIFGHNLPAPPSPALDEAGIAARIAGGLGEMRLGWVVSLVIMALYIPWTAQISTLMQRIETNSRALNYAQLIGGTLTVFVVSFGILCFAVATFRPERDPALMQLLTDFGWLSFELQWALTTVQMVAMALVGLADKRETPLFPRWACFLSIWCGLSFAPASLTEYLKTGPFAWDGILSFYIPWAAWLVWCFVISAYMLSDVRRRMAVTEAAGVTGRLANT